MMLFSAVETVHSPSKAYSSVNSRSSWRALLDPFQKLLERLSQEIEEEQLESLKFLLENHIPAGTLEECKTARNLFKCMKQKGLLGYNNLDFLEELLTEAKRLDLLEIVKEFKLQPAMEIDSGYPGKYEIRFRVTCVHVLFRWHQSLEEGIVIPHSRFFFTKIPHLVLFSSPPRIPKKTYRVKKKEKTKAIACLIHICQSRTRV